MRSLHNITVAMIDLGICIPLNNRIPTVHFGYDNFHFRMAPDIVKFIVAT